MPTRCCMPPESSWGNFLPNSRRPTSSSISVTVAVLYFFGRPISSMGMHTFRRTVRHS